MKDRWNREINYMRISVTDQCNLRCCYCMPEEGIPCIDKAELLTFEEIETIVRVGVSIGINTIKITGGEPLLREDITKLIKKIKNIDGIKQVTLTTNGVLLEQFADELKESGIDSININVPKLTRKKYTAITRRDQFIQIIQGIRKARDIGIHIKLNCVARKDMTEEELFGFAMIAKQYPIDIRFIEMMPLGFGKKYDTYSNENILQRIKNMFENDVNLSNFAGNGPAIYYEFDNFIGKIGFVSAVSHKFCSACNRIRLSADGNLKLCLNYDQGVSLKDVLRNGNQDLLINVMKQAIYEKPKAHCFYEKESDKVEMKNMVQIGG